MNAEQLALLRAELTSDPEQLGYAALLPDQVGRAVDLLNAPVQLMVREKFMTARSLMASIDPFVAAAFLDVLDGIAASEHPAKSVVKWAMKFLTSDPGLDIGHANTRALLDALQQGGALPADLVSLVKSLAVQPASRAEVLFGAGICITIEQALEALQ